MGRKRGSEHWVLDDAGNRTVLTPAVHAAVIATARGGYWPRMVAVLNGIDPDTLCGWLELGNSPDGYEPYASFAEAYLLAEAESCRELEDALRKAALGTSEARVRPEVLIWLLERRHPLLWKGGTLSALQVAAQSRSGGRLRAAAERFLAELPEAERDRARALGLNVPQLSEGPPGPVKTPAAYTNGESDAQRT